MVIGDFAGCPGVGKSTVCIKLQKELRNKNYKVFSEPKDWKHFGRIQRFINQNKAYLYKECRYLSKIGKQYVGSLTDANRNYWFHVVLMDVYYVLKAERKGCEYLLFDEGIIQAASSIEHDSISSSGVAEWIHLVIERTYKDRDVKIINCILDEEENIIRLKGRQRDGDRFLQGSDEIIRSRLEIKKENIKTFCRDIKDKVLDVDMKNFEEAYGIVQKNIEKRKEQ